MLPDVPASLDALLVLLRPVFTQPTFQTFRGLLIGQICQTRQRTVTGMLVGARLSGVWHHARAHRFFSSARWCPDQLGLRVLDVIVTRLLAPDAPLVIVIDDTLLHRFGRKVHACFYHHDATANSGQPAVAWGNNWVVAAISVKLPFLDRTVCLPVLMALWQPRRKAFAQAGKADPERPSKVALAARILALIAARYPDRVIHATGDAAYASGALAVSGRVTVTSRLRVNASLYAPKPPKTGRRGQPAKKGAKLPSLTQITADPATVWTAVTATRYAKTEQLMVHTLICLWPGAFGYTPVQVLIIQDPSRPAGYQLALVSTDLQASPAELIERYADRWPIEVCFEEAKHQAGVGHAHNRTPKAVQRTVPFQFLAMTLTVLWYALHGHHPDDVSEHRARAPWYRSKSTPSFADMLAKLRRTIIANEYLPGHHTTPATTVFTQVQHAWAAASL